MDTPSNLVKFHTMGSLGMQSQTPSGDGMVTIDRTSLHDVQEILIRSTTLYTIAVGAFGPRDLL